MEVSEEEGPLPLSSLRLLVPPLQLASAALWRVVQSRDIMNYGLLEEFVIIVLEMVPDLMAYREKVQLIMGLRARLILELCLSDHLADLEVIEPHLIRMKTSMITPGNEEICDGEVERCESKFEQLIQNILEDQDERKCFYQRVFPETFGPKYDSELQTLVWEFFSRLEQLLSIQNFEQVTSMLTSTSADLEECMHFVSHPQPLKTLLRYKRNQGHLVTNVKSCSVGDYILASLSNCCSERGNMNTAMQSVFAPEHLPYAHLFSEEDTFDVHQQDVKMTQRPVVLLHRLDDINMSSPTSKRGSLQGTPSAETLLKLQGRILKDGYAPSTLERDSGMPAAGSHHCTVHICSHCPFFHTNHTKMLQHLKKFHKVHFTSKSPMAKCKVEGTMHHGGENGTEMTQSKKRYRQAFPSTSQINSGIVSSAAITDGAPCAVNICSHCPFFHTEQEKMLQHVEKFHPKKRSDPAVASDVMLFICPLCGKVTYSNDGLKAHMRVHAGDFKCHRCPRTFAAYTSLQRHLEDENGCKVDTDMGANEELLVLSDVKESPGSDLQCGTSKQISEENSETSTDSQHINVANDTDHLQCQEMKGTMSHGGETAAQTQSDERYKQAFPSSPEEIIDIIPRSSIPDGAPCTVHVCSHCPFFHTEPEKMLQHVEKFHSKQRSGPAVVSGGTIFMCPLCEKVMYSNDGLKAHIRIMHSGDFMCHRCPRTFAARTNLQRHLEDRNGCGGDSDMWGDEELLSDMEESPGQDSQCGTSTQIFEENSETSSDSYGGGNATEMTQSEERYEKAFPSSPEEISDIIIPRSSFPGGAPCTVLICSHCPFFHTEPETMRQHMKSHFNGEENATEMTTSSSSSESQIPQPQATATNSSDLPKSHQCPVCKRSFETAQLLSFHHEAFHVSQKGSRRVNSVQENPTWSLGCSQSDPCMCHICDAKFPHLRNVRQHYTGIHRFSGPFPCKHCGKTFDRLMELSRHQKNLSVQHKCGTCQKLFKSSDLLHEHKKVHSETVNQYLCDKCGKGLRSKMGWLLHQRLHRGERKWVCDICGQKFFQSSMLHRHMFDHTGERPYICTVCNKGFKASRDRDRHMSDIHTDLRPYKCDLCSRTFKRPLHLKRHQSNKSCSKYE